MTKKLSKSIYTKKNRPVKVIQFGEGNFLRGFVDWMIQDLNEQTDFNGSVAVVQPLKNGLCGLIDEQDGLYTHYMRGIKNGKAVSEYYVNDTIDSTINPYEDYEAFLGLAEIKTAKIIVSNTTEAGITYDENAQKGVLQESFPGKLLDLLIKRYEVSGGVKGSGFTIIPCELIESNGDKLKEIVIRLAEKWALGNEFMAWLKAENTFHNTLVDRIVPGYPKDIVEELWEEIGYKDQLIVQSEQFNLWVIDGDASIKEHFPLDKIEANVLFVEDIQPYRTRKVRILNGAHTTMVPVGYLYGVDTVGEVFEDDVLNPYVSQAIHEEIIPTLDLDAEELEAFAKDVVDRFKNPFVKHELLSIALNSMSKYNTRVLPSLKKYVEVEGTLPNRLVFALAALMVLYRGKRGEENFKFKDSDEVLDFYKNLWENYDDTKEGVSKLVTKVLAHEQIWKEDLNKIEGLNTLVSKYLYMILQIGIKEAIKEVL